NQISYDMLGRTVKTVEAYNTAATPPPNSNKTTEFTFDGAGHTTLLKADLPGGSSQQTQYVYGVFNPGAINSFDLLATVKYPAKDTGMPSAWPAAKESFQYNNWGETTAKIQRNFNTSLTQAQKHTYSFDVLGRITADAVPVFGDGVDTGIQKITTAFDTYG